jgi:hypothetical protein
MRYLVLWQRVYGTKSSFAFCALWTEIATLW